VALSSPLTRDFGAEETGTRPERSTIGLPAPVLLVYDHLPPVTEMNAEKMAVKLVVAVTDREWFAHIRTKFGLSEVNFWGPSGTSFRALEPGELFLFKLHAPEHAIAGGGVFVYANTLPCSLAWEAFGDANGAASLAEMRMRIARYRRIRPDDRSDFTIGCRILTQPFFLDENEWIPTPASWSRNIVSFKTYTTEESEGLSLWEVVQGHFQSREPRVAEPVWNSDSVEPRYGEPMLIRPRLGQGAFRIVVTDTYSRRCAITGERTLPALDAAHIRPYAEGGDHEVRNGLLLRRDIHSLFDAGYVTVTPEYRLEVSRRIREEFENGRDYYAMHGKAIALPGRTDRLPDRAALAWHNVNRFLG
jgi:putative restriction endonuclease